MPSIFIWKSSILPSLSNHSQTIRYYSGNDWFLEEVLHDRSRSKSFQYMDCMECEGFTVYDVKERSKDWVGAYLLESITVPYRLIKEDAEGYCDQIGVWTRFVSKTSYSFEKNKLEHEFERIKQWAEK